MKICIVAKTFPPEKLGGAEIYAESIACALNKKGHEVIVITQQPYSGLSSLFPRPHIKNGIKLYRFYPLNIFSLYNAKNKPLFLKGLWRAIDLLNPLPAILIRNIISKEKPDITHLNMLLGFSQLFLVRLLAKMQIPLILTLHSYEFFCLKCDLLKSTGGTCQKANLFCRLFIYLSRHILSSLPNTIISPSKSCLDIYEKYGLFKRCKKVVLPNAVETYANNPRIDKIAAKRKFIILYAGRLVKIKGIHILISAFRELTRENIELWLAGDGTHEETLKELASTDKRIRFLGKLPHNKVKKLYQESDVSVLPSIFFDISPFSALESLAAGCPVIASRIGGMQELIRDGYNGCLVEPNDIGQLRKTMESLIEDTVKLRKLSLNAFESSKNFSIDDYTAKLEKIYAQAINDNA